MISCFAQHVFLALHNLYETLEFQKTVKVWDVENGKDIFEFSNAHGDFAVTCMTFDDNGRRLITES